MSMLIDAYRFGGGGGGDPYFANVTYLLHGEGVNGGTVITDVKGGTWSANGGAVTSTAQAAAGLSSIAFNGGNISCATALGAGVGTGDFCIEGFFYATSTTTRGLFHTQLSSSANGIAAGWDQGSGTWQVYFGGSVQSAGATLTLNAWTHYALERAGTTVTLYINGSSVVSFTSAANITDTGIFIGAYFNAAFPWVNFEDECRGTVGVARYGSPFSPPAIPFPDS